MVTLKVAIKCQSPITIFMIFGFAQYTHNVVSQRDPVSTCIVGSSFESLHMRTTVSEWYEQYLKQYP